MNSNSNLRNNASSYKAFKITPHAKQRAFERLKISSEDELKKRARAAKYKGINLATIKFNDLSHEEKQILTQEDVQYLISHFKITDGRKKYFYKDYIWVFCGKDGKTLVSIIPCSKQDREYGYLIMKLGVERFKTMYPEQAKAYYLTEQERDFKKMYCRL